MSPTIDPAPFRLFALYNQRVNETLYGVLDALHGNEEIL